MSKNRSSALKRDREIRKNEKRAEKRLRRENRKQNGNMEPVQDPASGSPNANAAEIEAGAISVPAGNLE